MKFDANYNMLQSFVFEECYFPKFVRDVRSEVTEIRCVSIWLLYATSMI